ncbi:MAG: pilin [bacterium]|nr:pilin [bacterium]
MLKNKKIFIISLVSFLFLLLGGFSFVQALEIQYPTINGWDPNTVTTNILPEYIRYIFAFSVAIAGFIAFGALVYGGIRYATSAGDPSKAKDGRDRISAGILGLVFLLSSYLILTTINPQLVILTITRPTLPLLTFDLPGVYLSVDGSTSTMKAFTNSESSLGNLNDKANQIKIINPKVWNPELASWVTGGDYTFRAVLHEDADYKGQCRLFFNTDPATIQGKDSWGSINQPSSISVFRKDETKTQGSIKLCTDTDGVGTCQSFNSSAPVYVGDALNDKIKSAYPDPGSFAVLFQHSPADASFPGICQTVTGNIPDLKIFPINKCDAFCPFGFCLWWTYTPCTSGVVVFPVLK